MKEARIAAVIVLVVISVGIVLMPRIFKESSGDGSFYSYPLHRDEWQHYTIAMSLDENILQPSVFYYQDDEAFPNGSPLFHWSIYLSQKFGLSPENFFILPIFQIILFSIFFFLWLAVLFNPIVGFLGTLFALFVQSNLRVLGILFFHPSVLGLAFFALALLVLHKKGFLSPHFIFVSLIALFIYPPYIIPLVIYILFYEFVNNKLNWKSFIGLTIFSAAILLFYFFALKGNFSLISSKIVYKDFWTGFERINLINYFGILFIIFGLFGLIKTLKNRKLLPFHALFAFFSLNLFFTLVSGYSIGFHYVRLIYLGGIFFAVYVGNGVWALFQSIKTKKRWLAVTVTSLLIIGIILPTIIFYRNFSSALNPHVSTNWLIKERMEAFAYLKAYDDKEVKLLHPPGLGSIITPLTDFKVTALPIGLTGGKTNKYYELEVASDCGKVRKIIKEENYKLLFLENKYFDCSFLKLVFENKPVVIYETDL